MKESFTILVVDDDQSINETLRTILKDEFNVITVLSGKAALNIVKKRKIDVILLDIQLPDINGLDVLKTIKDSYIDMEVIMITASKDIETAVHAIKTGAFDYITKDFDMDDIKARVWRVIDSLQKKKQLIYLQDEVKKHLDVGFIVGKSPRMKEIYYLVKKISKVPSTVLILGESGTGKERLARIIWKESDLSNNTFVPVNLASIPSDLVESILFGHEKGSFSGAITQHIGKFEMANNGFLFLDEIGDLRLDLQAKLLRAIQEGEIDRVGGQKTIKVNTRLIAATHADLVEKIEKGDFREDLYYRINVIPIKLPPLRERIEDIPILANCFLDKYSKRIKKYFSRGISEETLDLLSQYHWPGNIRELENLIERLVATADRDQIGIEDIPVEFQIELSSSANAQDSNSNKMFDNAVATFERNLILRTLEKHGWNRKKTASILGIPISTLKYKFKNLGIYEILEKRNL